MKNSGTIFVIAIVAVALVFGAVTWSRYTRDNPTSTDGTITFVDGAWRVIARFPAEHREKLRTGTGVIISSPAFPKLRMTGTLGAVQQEDTTFEIDLNHGPTGDSPVGPSPASVTVDSATAPR